jgi:hypothetical protein
MDSPCQEHGSLYHTITIYARLRSSGNAKITLPRLLKFLPRRSVADLVRVEPPPLGELSIQLPSAKHLIGIAIPLGGLWGDSCWLLVVG